MSNKLVAGYTIKLSTGREYMLPVTPAEPPEGSGAGKTWNNTEEEFAKVYHSLKDYKTQERNEVCELYHVSYQKLRKPFKDAGMIPETGKFGRAVKVDSSKLNTFALVEMKEGQLAQLLEKAEELKVEIAELKVDAIAEMEATLAQLKKDVG